MLASASSGSDVDSDEMDASLILDQPVVPDSEILEQEIQAKRQPKPLIVRPDRTFETSRRKLQAGGIKAIKINRAKQTRKDVILTLSGDRKTIIYRSNSGLSLN